MDKTNDIKYKLLKEVKWGRIKDCGYDCPSGRKYVEIRNALFEVDKPYIFEQAKSYSRVTKDWYKVHYDPILYRNNQFEGLIKKLANNPLTRQAIIYMGDSSEYLNGDEVICTMYMHIFLNHIKDNEYEMEYIVHMRSNDAIEFGNDIQWHYKIISKIAKFLLNDYNINIINTKVIWNADSFQIYKQYFELILK